MPELEVLHLTKKFGSVNALREVSLKVRNSEYLVLLGPSGCGKTTLLKIIGGIIKPSSGEVFVNGKNITHSPPEDRRIGFVFQNYALFPHMNLVANTMYGPRVRGEDCEETRKFSHEMLELVGLSARHTAMPHELSGGMQQRTALARALATGSHILLLDEPLSALDAKIRSMLRLEMRKMVTDLKVTAIHVTHDQEEAMVIADRIVVMRNGRVEQVGTPEEIYFKPATLFVASFVGEANFFLSRVNEKDPYTLHVLGRRVKIPKKPSGEYVAVVRPERIMLRKGGSGKIKSVRMIGGYYRYEISLGEETVVARSLEKLDGNVEVSFTRDDIVLFPYPREGLKKALDIE